jgi:hypothetical protein
MTFVGSIVEARDIEDVYELVNEFIEALHHSGESRSIPIPLRRISTAEDLLHCLCLVSEEVRRCNAASEDTPNIMLGLSAVLETALQKLSSDCYH